MPSKSIRPLTQPKTGRLRAALYIRVSTEEQAMQGFSINGQRDKMEMACNLYDWDPLPAYVDDGYSAKDLNRPQIKRLIQDARAGKFDVVVAYKLDRLARRLSDLLWLNDEFSRLGIPIRSATEAVDTASATGKLLFHMLGSFAQFEREMIIDRTKMGLQRRLKEGKWNTGAPFGYRLNQVGHLEKHEDEWAFARKVFELFLQNDLGAKNIARRLKVEDRVTRRAGRWARNSVYNMLKNPAYAGMYRIDGQLVAAPHEGIITPAQFHEIQKMLAGKSPTDQKTYLSPNILMGLIRCGSCGSVMTVGKGKGHNYYACTGRLGDRGCKMAWIPARPLEAAVLREIRAVANLPEIINDSIRLVKEETDKAKASLQAEQNTLANQIEGLERTQKQKIQWMLDTLPKGDAARRALDEVQAQIDSVKAMKMRQQEIELRLNDVDTNFISADLIAQYLTRFTDTFESLETGKKRILMQGLVKEIIVTGKNESQLVLSLPIPSKPQPIVKSKRGRPLDGDSPFDPALLPVPGVDPVHRDAPNGVDNGT